MNRTVLRHTFLSGPAGISQKELNSFASCKARAEQGNIDAQSSLASMCYEGQGTHQNYEEAFKLHLGAAKQGDALSQFNLGAMYFGGKGVSENRIKSLEWYLKAAKQGFVLAQSNLGAMYYEGQGTPRDYDKAFKWCSEAADKGDASAHCALGVMHYLGRGALQDYALAHMHWNIAAFGKDKRGEEFRRLATKIISPSQIAEAQKLAREWVAEHQQQKPLFVSMK